MAHLVLGLLHRMLKPGLHNLEVHEQFQVMV